MVEMMRKAEIEKRRNGARELAARCLINKDFEDWGYWRGYVQAMAEVLIG